MQFRRLTCCMLPLTLAVLLAVPGCSSLDELGQEKKIPLAGERKALFPQGIPGVEFGAPPSQPGNANIPINPGMMQNPDGQQAAQEDSDQQAAQSKQKQKQKQAAPAEKSSRTASRGKKSADEDPWVETR